jgi:hypothetical protein
MTLPRTELLTPQALSLMPGCVALIAASQSIAGARCIHTDFDVDADSIRAEPPDTIVYVLVRGPVSGGASPLAIFGADISSELKRAWLRGPFVTGDVDFATNASLAFDALLAHAGTGVDKWDAFTETSHQRALDWYVARGFMPLKRHSTYTVARDEARVNPVPDAAPPPVVISRATTLPQRATGQSRSCSAMAMNCSAMFTLRTSPARVKRM